MNMINVTGTTNGIALYNGDSVTCYPGSNQTDKGKLQLEFNMARFVTRLSSKNFCVTRPSFVVTSRQSTATGTYQLVVSAGQASINGMDLIITDSIAVNPPEQTGTFYLVMRLQRDDDNGQGNVLGDLVVGATTTFQGVCLTYYDEKDTSDPDFFYLAKITWDGEDFTSIEEDEDKYGRIWAEDILAKINDPKHPNVSRLLLQEWIDIVPDWYVSKEGDVEFEAIEWLPGRQNGNYTSADYGTGKYGIQIQAVNDNKTIINKKASSIAESNQNLTVKETITNTKIEYKIGKLKATIDSTDSYTLDIDTPNKIDITSSKDVEIKSNTKYFAQGDSVGFLLEDNKVQIGDLENISNVLEWKWLSGNKDLEHTFGQAYMKYNITNKKITVYKNDSSSHETLTNITIQPEVNLGDDLTVAGNVTVTGEVTASKVWNACYNGFGEIFRKDRNEFIDYGDLVCMDKSGLVRKVKYEDDLEKIIGVCSNTIGIGLGGKDIPPEEQVEVEMVGQIWVKTNNTFIQPGDIVQAKYDGTVERTTSSRYKFGIAGTGVIDGKVLVIVR